MNVATRSFHVVNLSYILECCSLHFFKRYGILSMFEVGHCDENWFQQCLVLPGSSDGYTPTSVAQGCMFLPLGPRESLRNTLIRTTSNNEQIFKQLFLCEPSKAENMRTCRRNMFHVFIIGRFGTLFWLIGYICFPTHQLRRRIIIRCICLSWSQDLSTKSLSSVTFLQNL